MPVVCSNNTSAIHLCQDITTCAVHETDCDLRKSFSFDKTVEFTNYLLRTSIHVKIYLLNACYIISRRVEVRKAVDGKSGLQGLSRSLYW